MKRLTRHLRRRQLDRELDGEIAAHIAEKADELVESGVAREEALRTARAMFGNRTAVHEQSREVWNFGLLESAWRDLRIAGRGLRRAPLFTAVAAATLAIGIGANAAVFSLIHAVLLRPLPFPNADHIVMLWEKPPARVATGPAGSRDHNPTSPMNFMDWRDRTHSFEAMAAFDVFPMGLSGFGAPRPVKATRVSAAFFRVLGSAPLLGRVFDNTEDVPNGPPVAVLSYALWREQFGADPSVLGRAVLLNDMPFKILGVMPEGFDLPFASAQIWAPIQLERGDRFRQGRYLRVIARLKPGVSITQAQADLAAVAQRISEERPESSRDWTASVIALFEQTTGNVSRPLLLLFGAVTFVLLIAAGNVANLLLMRGTGRSRELAVRAALGASRVRLAAQLLAESLLLAVAGGLLGIGLAFWGLRAIVHSLPELALPRMEGVGVNAPVLAFSLALCLGATFLFGLAPALAFSRTNPEDAIRQNTARITGRGRRIRGVLVVAEVALSLVLLTGAGLLVRSFINQTTVNRGFRTDHILTMRMFFAPARYSDAQRRAQYINRILANVRAVPGVEQASSAHFLPMVGSVSGSGFRRLDQPEPAPGTGPDSDFLIVSPNYFAVMGIPILRGRDFNRYDTASSSDPAIIVNQVFVDKFFPHENPIGAHLQMEWNVDHGVIVGVVANARQSDLTTEPAPTIFLSQDQSPMYYIGLVVRTPLPPAAIAKSVQSAIHTVDPDQAISDVESMDEVVAESIARPRLESVLTGVFAAIALILAAIGLYGVLAYSVSERTREIGIRMALGANSAQLVRAIVRDGLSLILPGLLVGLAASLALTRLMRSLLYAITPSDPATFIGACAILLAIGLLASWLPARRAAAIDPATSLRWE
jgi:predicted permease